MGGQIRMRARCHKYAIAWFDNLIVSKEEMENIIGDTGWEIVKIIESVHSPYITVIEKKI